MRKKKRPATPADSKVGKVVPITQAREKASKEVSGSKASVAPAHAPVFSAYIRKPKPGLRGIRRWTALGEQSVKTMIRLAEAGNIDSGRRLLQLLQACMSKDDPLPMALKKWLGERIDAILEHPEHAGQHLYIARRKGRPPAHHDDMYAALKLESIEQQAAWAAFREIQYRQSERSGPGTKVSRDLESKTAFEVVSEWLASRGIHKGPSWVERHYSERLQAMKEETYKVQAYIEDPDRKPE
jgi:hypothetical protein